MEVDEFGFQLAMHEVKAAACPEDAAAVLEALLKAKPCEEFLQAPRFFCLAMSFEGWRLGESTGGAHEDGGREGGGRPLGGAGRPLGRALAPGATNGDAARLLGCSAAESAAEGEDRPQGSAVRVPGRCGAVTRGRRRPRSHPLHPGSASWAEESCGSEVEPGAMYPWDWGTQQFGVL